MEEITLPAYFGEWLKYRRKELDLTQAELARRASCSLPGLRKIEAGERRPSKQLAGLLAKALEIPPEDQIIFMKVARGELNVERLPMPGPVRAADLVADQKTSSIGVNLPFLPTSFIGRETELAALRKLLADPQCRLLTITGMGGIGKTRLAVELAFAQQAGFPGGVYFVSLASLNSPEYIVPAIADVLKLTFSGPLDPQEQFLTYLKFHASQATLLILDNLEHLLTRSGSADILEDAIVLLIEMLRRAPNLKILVTSRERISIQGEWTFELHGMPFPTRDQSYHLEDYSAPTLFVQRARQVKADFEVLPDERSSLAKICELIEGTPLAIELAAAWVELLSLDEIAREITSNLEFLTSSMRDIPERHRSMNAVFDHSWKMLSAGEQQALSKLSVFQGGFQRQAAEQVAGATLPILSSLMNQTLLRRVTTDRYDLHELVRQYSAARLAADPQNYLATKKQHYDFFLALAEEADQELRGHDQLVWLGRLEQDRDNLRVALEWALECSGMIPGSEELALRLSGPLRWFWRMRGYFHEGRGWLTKALQKSPKRPTAARAGALLGLSNLLNALGDLTAALPLAEESAAIYRELDDPRGLAEALIVVGLTLVWQGEAVIGCARVEEALVISRKAGNRWGEAQALNRLGCFLADYRGDLSGRTMLVESAAILESLGEKFLFVSVLISLGIIDSSLGEYAVARTHFERSLAIAREIKHPWGIADALTNLSCVLRIQGEYPVAQSLMEESQRVYQEHGSSIWESDVLCSQAENCIAQGDFPTARLHLQAASSFVESSSNKWLQALVGYFQGLLLYYEGDAGGAARLLEMTIELAREGQYKPDLARALVALGRVRRTLGEVASASVLLQEGLELFRALGHKLGIATALEEAGALSTIRGDGAQAVMLFSVANALREEIGALLPPVDRAAYDGFVSASRAQLGESAFTAAWERAAAMPFQEVVEEILKDKR